MIRFVFITRAPLALIKESDWMLGFIIIIVCYHLLLLLLILWCCNGQAVTLGLANGVGFEGQGLVRKFPVWEIRGASGDLGATGVDPWNPWVHGRVGLDELG